MKKYLSILAIMLTQCLYGQRRTVDLTILHTSDVHGAVFSYDYMEHRQKDTGMPFVFAYADSLRRQLGERLIITDGGDCLQGQPTAYYSNYIDTTSEHFIAKVMNQMHYDCVTIGNHDIETGHAVYDRWIRQLKMPVLGANVVDTRTGQPYFTPYIILNRAGVRIAILGMLTNAVPFWLPANLWSNMRFEDVEESSARWAREIQEREHPDLLIGLFHSGFNEGIVTDECRENATEMTARNVPGFDIILYGHDHRYSVKDVVNKEGKTVKCMGTRNGATCFIQADVQLEYEGDKLIDKKISGKPLMTASVNRQMTTRGENRMAMLFEAEFVDERLELNSWVERSIGHLAEDLEEKDAFFGPSKFIDFIHRIQLQLTGADVSFTAPLSFRTVLKAGELKVSHMFNLYKFENLLYTMRLTGREIKGALEMSYAKWVNQMQSPNDHIMLLKKAEGKEEATFENMTFNFDSAAGILYTVDVTKPAGQRISILSMEDGTPFSPDKEYRVAVNSYRGNGGGELLTEGAGIPRDKLSQRILASTEKDLRYYIIQYIEQHKTIAPKCLNQWRFIPEELAKPAIERDRKLLFGE